MDVDSWPLCYPSAVVASFANCLFSPRFMCRVVRHCQSITFGASAFIKQKQKQRAAFCVNSHGATHLLSKSHSTCGQTAAWPAPCVSCPALSLLALYAHAHKHVHPMPQNVVLNAHPKLFVLPATWTQQKNKYCMTTLAIKLARKARMPLSIFNLPLTH